MYASQHMMGILVASTALLGLTVVVIGQIIQRNSTKTSARIDWKLPLSIIFGIVTVLSILAWFLTLSIIPNATWVMIMLLLTNAFFLIQIGLFAWEAFLFWGQYE